MLHNICRFFSASKNIVTKKVTFVTLLSTSCEPNRLVRVGRSKDRYRQLISILPELYPAGSTLQGVKDRACGLNTQGE
jgi:hypothetical protein